MGSINGIDILLLAIILIQWVVLGKRRESLIKMERSRDIWRELTNKGASK